jgi:hypothetical protein
MRDQNVRYIARLESRRAQTVDEFATVALTEETTGSRVDEHDAIAEREHPR